MGLKTKSIRPRILYQYIFSYIVVLTIPLVILSFVINNSFMSKLKDQITNFAVANMKTAQDQIEINIRKMDDIAVTLSGNAYLNSNALDTGAFSKMRVIETIASFAVASDYILEIAYSINETGHIYTTKQFADIDLYLSSLYFSDKEMRELLRNEIYNSETPHLLFLNDDDISSISRPISNLVYIYPLNKRSQNLTLMFFINSSEFTSVLYHAAKSYVKDVYVIDGNNNIVTHKTGGSDIINRENAVDIMSDLMKSSNGIIEIEGGKYLVASTHSEKLGIYYVSVIDNDSLFDELSDLRRILIWAYVILVFLGLAVSVLASSLNAAPVVEIIQSIENKRDKESEKIDNIKMVKGIIDEIYKTNVTLSEKVDKYVPIIKRHLLNEIMKQEKMPVSGLEEELEFLFPSYTNKFICIVQTVDNSVYYNLEVLKSRADEQNEAMTLLNVLNIDYTEENKHILIIATDENISGKLTDPLKELTNRLFHESDSRLFVAVGSMSNDILTLGQSYTEAISIINNKALCQMGEIIFYSPQLASTIPEFDNVFYPHKELRRLNSHIGDGNMQGAKELLNAIVNKLLKDNIPPFFKRCIMFEVFNILIKLAMSSNINNKTVSVLMQKDYETDSDLHNLLNDICQNIFDYMGEEKPSNKTTFVNEIKDYICAEYGNADLTCGSIASKFNVSAANLSHTWSEMSDENLSDYIWDIRLEKARELLADTDILIKNVSKMVGYEETSSFNRKFKSSLGITPNEYRKRNA